MLPSIAKKVKKISRFLGMSILLLPAPALAQLTWGPGGAGGTGTWSSSSLDWYNGSSNVIWVSGDIAIFNGTAGVVMVTGTQTARQLTFSSSSGNYTLTGGTLDGYSSGLGIQATSSARINSSIVGVSGTIFTESGAGTLSLGSTLSGFSQLDLSGTLSGGTIDGASAGLAIQATGNTSLGSSIVGSSGSTLTESGTGTLTLGSTVSGFNQINLSGTITGGTIDGNSSGLTIQTNSSGSMDSYLYGTSGTVLTKSGSGSLALGDSVIVGFSQINVTAGTLSMGYGQANNDSGTGASINLANAANVILALNEGTVGFGSLSGGGALGGIVEPSSTTENSTLQLEGVSEASFAGVLQDNGGGKLSLYVANSQTLTGVNTYSGSTSVDDGGTLILSGSGSIAGSTSIGIASGGTLEIDNSATNSASRLSTTAPISMASGSTFLYQGSSSAASAETFGQIDLGLYGAAEVEVNAGSGQSATATFAGLSNPNPDQGGVIDFSGTGTTRITGLSNTDGIIGPYATYGGTEWASLDSNNDVVPFSNYNTNINSALATDNVKIAGGGLTTLQSSEAINTLNLQDSSGNSQTLDLGGQTLSLQGILSSGSSGTAIQNGTLSVTYIINANSLTVGASITNSTGLIKSGTGTLILTGTSTYSGVTTIDEGTLQIGNGGTTGSLPNSVEILGGNLIFDRSNTVTQGVDFSGAELGLYLTSLTQAGTGTLALSGNNYILDLTAQNGTVSFDSVSAAGGDQPLGTGLTVYVGGAGTTGTLQYTGGSGTLTQNITGLGNGVLVNSGGGILTLSGTLTKSGTVLTFGGGSFNVTGQITGGTSGTFDSDLVVNNGSIVTLDNSNNNYTGPTDVYGGATLKDGLTNALPQGTVLTLGDINDGAVTNTFDLDGNNQAIAALNSTSNGGSNVNIVTNGATSGANILTLTGVNSDGASVNGTFGGIIQDGLAATTALAVTGGTQTLTGSNTYSGGTTIVEGTLLANNSSGSATGSGNVAVDIGGILGGLGTIAPTSGHSITVASGGNISPGTAPQGSVAQNSLNISDASLSSPVLIFAAPSGATRTVAQLTFNLGSGTAPTDSSGLSFAGSSSYIKLTSDVAGEVQFNNNLLQFNDLTNGRLTINGNYLLFQGGSDSDYAGLTLNGNGQIIAGLYLTGASDAYYNSSELFLTDGDIYVDVVPEPSVWTLLSGGFAFLILTMRRPSPFSKKATGKHGKE